MARMVNVRGQRQVAGRAVAGVIIAGVCAAGLLAASPASAAVTATINTPADKSSYTAYQDLSVDATVNYGVMDSGTATLTATDPDYTADPKTGCTFTVAQVTYNGSSGGSRSSDVKGPLDLSAAYAKTCSSALQGKPAVNGKWRITLTTSGTSLTNTFTTAVAPAAPSGVTATSGAPSAVTVAWNPNTEPDTHAYAVLDGAGKIVSGPTDAGTACPAGSCSASITGSPTGSQSFVVRAYRYSGPPSTAPGPDLTADSPAQTVVVQGAAASAGPTQSAAPTSGDGGGGSTPPASSKAAPTTGGSQAGGTTGSGSGTAGGGKPGPSTPVKVGALPPRGSGVLNNTASAGEAAKISAQFHNFAPSAGLDKLPPLPKLDAAGGVSGGAPAVAADDGEPTDDGTFNPTLGYAPESKTVATHSVTTPLSSVADAFGISPEALLRSLAGSLVLLLCAGHVRRWARQPID